MCQPRRGCSRCVVWALMVVWVVIDGASTCGGGSKAGMPLPQRWRAHAPELLALHASWAPLRQQSTAPCQPTGSFLRAGAHGPPHAGRAAQQHQRERAVPGGLAGGQRLRAAAQPHGGCSHCRDQVGGQLLQNATHTCLTMCQRARNGLSPARGWMQMHCYRFTVTDALLQMHCNAAAGLPPLTCANHPFSSLPPIPSCPPPPPPPLPGLPAPLPSRSRSSVWQWLRYGVALDDGQPLTVDRVSVEIQRELDAMRKQVGGCLASPTSTLHPLVALWGIGPELACPAAGTLASAPVRPCLASLHTSPDGVSRRFTRSLHPRLPCCCRWATRALPPGTSWRPPSCSSTWLPPQSCRQARAAGSRETQQTEQCTAVQQSSPAEQFSRGAGRLGLLCAANLGGPAWGGATPPLPPARP